MYLKAYLVNGATVTAAHMCCIVAWARPCAGPVSVLDTDQLPSLLTVLENHDSASTLVNV
jgi:hypothetical protein